MNKLSPKGVKICKGCPPKTVEPVVTPKFNFGTPVKKESTKVVTLVDMSKYKKGNKIQKKDKNALF